MESGLDEEEDSDEDEDDFNRDDDEEGDLECFPDPDDPIICEILGEDLLALLEELDECFDDDDDDPDEDEECFEDEDEDPEELLDL